MACIHIEVRTAGPLVSNRGSELLTTPPPVLASAFSEQVAHPPKRIFMRTCNIQFSTFSSREGSGRPQDGQRAGLCTILQTNSAEFHFTHSGE
jgi:hypothetical protein